MNRALSSQDTREYPKVSGIERIVLLDFIHRQNPTEII
jgi:hypothetical protein